MDDFDTRAEMTGKKQAFDEDAREARRARFRAFVNMVIKKFVLFLSFGPGVLGFLWLIGRILRR